MISTEVKVKLLENRIRSLRYQIEKHKIRIVGLQEKLDRLKGLKKKSNKKS